MIGTAKVSNMVVGGHCPGRPVRQDSATAKDCWTNGDEQSPDEIRPAVSAGIKTTPVAVTPLISGPRNQERKLNILLPRAFIHFCKRGRPMKPAYHRQRLGWGVTSLGIAVVTMLHWAAPASAATITAYGSDAAWTAAAGSSISIEDFADTTLAPGLTIPSMGGGSISGGQLSNALAVYGLCVNGGTGCPATTEFDFGPSTLAFGGDWDLAPGGAGSGIFFDVTLTGGAHQTVSGFTNPAAGGTFLGFYGFVSDVGITSIRLGSGFTGNGELFSVDNVKFQVAGGNPIPEPATLALVSLSLFAAALTRRR